MYAHAVVCASIAICYLFGQHLLCGVLQYGGHVDLDQVEGAGEALLESAHVHARLFVLGLKIAQISHCACQSPHTKNANFIGKCAVWVVLSILCSERSV